MDIHNKDFKRSFRGYNEDEIDDFLDQVVNDYEKLFRENERLKEDLARAQKDNEHFHEREKSINDTLLLAQKTAEETTSHARKSAAEMKENMERECQNMHREAELSIKQQLEDATNRVRAIVAEYDRLVREKNKFLRKVKVTMESELAVINQTLAELPDPEAEENKQNVQVTISEEERMALTQNQETSDNNMVPQEERNEGEQAQQEQPVAQEG